MKMKANSKTLTGIEKTDTPSNKNGQPAAKS